MRLKPNGEAVHEPLRTTLARAWKGGEAVVREAEVDGNTRHFLARSPHAVIAAEEICATLNAQSISTRIKVQQAHDGPALIITVTIPRHVPAKPVLQQLTGGKVPFVDLDVRVDQIHEPDTYRIFGHPDQPHLSPLRVRIVHAEVALHTVSANPGTRWMKRAERAASVALRPVDLTLFRFGQGICEASLQVAAFERDENPPVLSQIRRGHARGSHFLLGLGLAFGGAALAAGAVEVAWPLTVVAAAVAATGAGFISASERDEAPLRLRGERAHESAGKRSTEVLRALQNAIGHAAFYVGEKLGALLRPRHRALRAELERIEAERKRGGP